MRASCYHATGKFAWYRRMLGEPMELDRRRLQDEAYRNEVLTALLRDYQDRIFRYCGSRLGEMYGEEVAQEVFLTAWENLSKFRQDASLETWLTGIAKYKCIQAFRNRTRRQTIARIGIEDIRQRVHAEIPEAPEHLAISQDQFARLADCLAKLRDDERILLNLRYLKSLPISEIVDLWGKSEAAVRKRILRALRRLRELMDADSAD